MPKKLLVYFLYNYLLATSLQKFHNHNVYANAAFASNMLQSNMWSKPFLLKLLLLLPEIASKHEINSQTKTKLHCTYKRDAVVPFSFLILAKVRVERDLYKTFVCVCVCMKVMLLLSLPLFQKAHTKCWTKRHLVKTISFTIYFSCLLC